MVSTQDLVPVEECPRCKRGRTEVNYGEFFRRNPDNSETSEGWLIFCPHCQMVTAKHPTWNKASIAWNQGRVEPMTRLGGLQ